MEFTKMDWVFSPGTVTRENVASLHTKIDAFFARVARDYSNDIVCRAGCSGCCHQELSLTSVEMAEIVLAVQELEPATRDRLRQRLAGWSGSKSGGNHVLSDKSEHFGQFEARVVAEAGPTFPESGNDVVWEDGAPHQVCPLLEDEHCVVYAHRPTICRSHGLVVEVTDDSGQTIRDVCPLNFRGKTVEAVPSRDVLAVDRINQVLGIIQHMAAQRAEVPAERLPLRHVLAQILF